MATEPTVRIQNALLKNASEMRTAGTAFTIVTVGWLIFICHSGVVQWHRSMGTHYLNLTEAGDEVFRSDGYDAQSYSAMHRRAAAASFRHFQLADEWGLLDTGDVKRGLTWLHLLRGEDELAEQRMHEAIQLAPNAPAQYEHLVALQLKRGRVAEAIKSMEKLLTVRPATAADHLKLASLMLQRERYRDAADQYRAALTLHPESAEVHYNLGGLLGRMGRFEEAIDQLRAADQLQPQDVDTHIELAIALAGAGRTDEAIATLERIADFAPDDPRRMQYLSALRQGNPESQR